jgi:two-component system cell cycle sensor histidine kinase/response regulator CckA
MKAWLLSFVRTPAFEDDDDRRAAQLLRLVLSVCLACILGYALATLDNHWTWSRRLPLFGALFVTLVCDWALRRGYVRPQAWVIVIGLTALALASQVTSGGLRAPASLTLFVAVVLAGQLLGWGGALIVAAVGSLGTLAVYQLYFGDGVARPLLHSEAQYARALVVQLMGTGSLIAIAAWSLSSTMRRLRSEQAAYRDLLEQAPDAMASVDQLGRISQVNRAFEKLMGRSREQLIGQTFDATPEALDAETFVKVRERYRALMAGEQVALYRFELIRPDGSRVLAESNARLVRRTDGSTGIDVVLRDVTKQVQAEGRQQELEAQLRAARKLEAIGQLAGGVAHDFNNLLSVVLGNLQLLRLTSLSPEQEESLVSMESAANRASQITRQLLAIGRRQPSRPLALSLNDSVRQISGLLRRMVPEHVSIITELDAELPNIVADAAQVDQVLLNLVANARDAMPHGGELRIETFPTNLLHPEQLPPLAAGMYATLRIKDSGLGMSQETRDRVFEPFFSTKSPSVGTGLGLATVYGIVKQHGGHIVVESAEGAGASFSVYLPATRQPQASPERPAPSPVRRSARLLLVDDDEAVRSVIATILRRAGHQVAVAAGGPQALELAAGMHEKLELLVTDVVMPEMSGVELSRELARRLPELKVLFLSGYPGSNAGSAQDKNLDYLPKPVTPTQLLERIDQLLGST